MSPIGAGTVAVGVAVVVAGLLGAGVFLSRVLAWAVSTDRERPVLPSHYSSLLQVDRSRYPGHCPACGTDNEPGYRYCEDCGGEIPTSADFDGSRDVGAIFGE